MGSRKLFALMLISSILNFNRVSQSAHAAGNGESASDCVKTQLIQKTKDGLNPPGFLTTLGNDATIYWRNQTQPVVDLLRGRSTRSQAVNALSGRLPPKILKVISRAESCGFAAACLTKLGIKTAYSPAFIIWDGFRIPFRSFKKTDGLSSQAAVRMGQRLLLIPVQMIYQNTPYIIGYTALLYAGWNIPLLAQDRSTTYLDELDDAVPRMKPFRPNELLVVVKGKAVDQSLDTATDYFVNSRKGNGLVTDAQVVYLTVSTKDEFIEKLGALRKQGRIKELVVMAHGEQGSFDFNDPGLSAIIHPWAALTMGNQGEIDKKTLPALEKETRSWPDDLFASDARIDLLSCDVAEGAAGKKFVKNLAGILLQHGGELIASPREVNASDVTRAQTSDSFNPEKNDFSTNLGMNFLLIPVISAINPPFMHINKSYFQGKVRVIRVEEK